MARVDTQAWNGQGPGRCWAQSRKNPQIFSPGHATKRLSRSDSSCCLSRSAPESVGCGQGGRVTITDLAGMVPKKGNILWTGNNLNKYLLYFLLVLSNFCTPLKLVVAQSSCCGSAVTNLTRICEDVGSIPALAQWVKDPVLPWAATVAYIADGAQIQGGFSYGCDRQLQHRFDP